MSLRRLFAAIGLLAASAFPVHAAVEWFGSAEANAVYGNNTPDDDEESSSASSLGLRGMIGVESTDSHGSTRLEASSRYVDYRDAAHRDRINSEIELRRRFDFSGPWSLDLTGSAGWNLWTVELPFADQWMARARLAFRPDDNTRLRGFVSYLQRYYDDDARSQGQGVQFGADYRRRIGKGAIDLSADNLHINADDPRYDNDRTTLEAAYSRDLTSKLEASLGVRGRRTVFDGRPADPLSGQGHRQDWTVRPEFILTYRPTDPVQVSLDYRYTRRDSNDNSRDRDGHSVGLRLTYRF